MSASQNECQQSNRVSSPFAEIEDMPTEMVYEQGGVSQKIILTHSSGKRGKHETLIPGKLLITQNLRGTYIEWRADAGPSNCSNSSERLMTHTNGVGYSRASSTDHVSFVFSDNTTGSDKNVKLDLTEIRSFSVTQQKHGPEELVIYLSDGSLQNPFVFHKGSPNNIIAALYRFVDLEQQHRNRNSYLVRAKRDIYSTPPSFADLLPDSARNVLGYVNDFTTDPKSFTTTMLAKVGGVVANSAHNYIQQQLNISPPNSSPPPETRRDPEPENKDHFADYTTNDEGYEVVFKPDKCVELTPRSRTYRGQQLSQEQWLDYMDNLGRIKNFEEIKSIVFRGGVDVNIKKPVWPFLLGLYSPDSTYEERKASFRLLSQDYKRMKNQWLSVTEDQESRFHAFRDYKSLIEKDVARTDRAMDYFKGDDSEGMEILKNILLTYMMYNFNLGYVQGMSDILAPILMEVQDEIEAFWLFVRFMDRINSNFEMSQEGMKQQLSDMYTILQIVDPMFSAYLDACDASNMFFAFRWMLILFKREFSPVDTLTLWEALWTELPGPNFHLIFGVAILEAHRDTVMDNKYGLSEILRHLNDLSLRIDLEEALKLAEAIYLQLVNNSEKLPKRAKEVLGLPTTEEAGPSARELGNAVRELAVEEQPIGDSLSCSPIQLDQDDNDRLETQYELSISHIM